MSDIKTKQQNKIRRLTLGYYFFRIFLSLIIVTLATFIAKNNLIIAIVVGSISMLLLIYNIVMMKITYSNK